MTSLVALTLVFAGPLAAQARPDSGAKRLADAELQWEAGDYPRALAGLQAVLAGPEASRYRERIALLTGEAFVTTPVAENARAPRWSADGSHAAWETGSAAAPVTVIARLEGDRVVPRDSVSGRGLVFSPDASRVAYLGGRGDEARVIVRTVATGMESPVALGGRVAAQVAFGTDGTLLVVAAPAGSATAAVFAVGADGALTQRSVTPEVAHALQVPAGGTHLVYGVGGRSPIAIGTGRAFVRGPAYSQVGILDLADGRERIINGESATLSADGSTLAVLERRGDTTHVVVHALRAGSGPRVALSTTDQVTSPALSPRGDRVTVQQMLREDWELVTIDVSGAEPVATRVTREIQHDLQPRWLSDTRLLAVMGEGRHRRSYLYENGTRTRLFHNNTVRTIAPEYEWAPSPDGRRILIVAERDGDTVTPHRHLWCLDLGTPVTVAALRTRVDSALDAERALRTLGERLFAPIAPQVRRAVAEVDVNRVYGYERDLFAFDSKHVTQPGNAKARAYLDSTYRSFGIRDVRQQAFTARGRIDGGGVETANILAVVPGTAHPELVYVVSSHFDSRAEGPGADDNTSGTAALLEAARVLASRPQPATIMFASFTGEEAGLLGSREFVRQAKADGLKLVGALNNDMVGWANDQRLDNTIRYSNAGIRDLQHGAAIQFTNLITYDAFYYKSTDAQAFYDGYGDVVGGIGSYPVLGNPHYHQPHDVLETINHQLVAEVAKTTVATLMYLAASPSRLGGLIEMPAGATPGVRIAWTASPESDVTGYLVQYGPPDAPTRWQLRTSEAQAVLPQGAAGMHVAVKAVNRAGLEGWDWARLVLGGKE